MTRDQQTHSNGTPFKPGIVAQAVGLNKAVRVEVMGRYSNHPEQGERIQAILDLTPSGPILTKSRTPKQVHRRLRPDEIDDLVAKYQEGRTVYELEREFHIRRDTVSLILKRRDVTMRNQPLDLGQAGRAVALYASGLSLASVGNQLGCAATTVKAALMNAGVPTRFRPGKRE